MVLVHFLEDLFNVEFTLMIEKSDSYYNKQEWGLEFPEEPTCFVSIDDYRSLLIDTATGKVEGKQVDCNGKIAAYTLGAIVPKMRLYSHLFHQIWTIRDPSHTPHIYNKWIGHYSSQDFDVRRYYFC